MTKIFIQIIRKQNKRGIWEEVDHELTVDAPMVVRKEKEKTFNRLEAEGPTRMGGVVLEYCPKFIILNLLPCKSQNQNLVYLVVCLLMIFFSSLVPIRTLLVLNPTDARPIPECQGDDTSVSY